MDFMENLQWPSKTAVSRCFWRFTKMVRKTVRFVFSQNPFRRRFFSLNEPLKKLFFWKIKKRTVFRAFWSWEVTNFFLTKPNFLPIINFFCQNHQKSTNVHCFLFFIYKSLLLFPKYIGYKFYGCTTIFDEFMIFWKKKNFVIFFFWKKNYQGGITVDNFFSKKKKNNKKFFFKIS